MATSKKRHQVISRFRGAVLGAAIGDALAFPHEHYSRSFLSSLAHPLAEEYVVPPSGFHPAGQYGYATQTMLAVLSSIVESGEVTGEGLVSHLLPLWHGNLLVKTEPSMTEAMRRIADGTDWRDAGMDVGHAESAPLARTIALALWNHQDPERLVDVVGLSTRITHKDPRVSACAAACAAAVACNLGAEELILGEFLDAVGTAAGAYDGVIRDVILDFPRILSQTESRALLYLMSLCADTRYPQGEDGLGEYCVPTTLTAIYYFLRSPYQFPKVADWCLRLGGRIDMVTFLAGAITGALVGDERLPSGLVAGLLNSTEIAACVAQLHEAWLSR